MMDDVVEGEMHCAKCKFRLSRRTLYMNGIGSGTNETEPCPNGCGPLWPVTWRMLATELGERLEEYFAELVSLREKVSATVNIEYIRLPMPIKFLQGSNHEDFYQRGRVDGHNSCVDEIKSRYNVTKKDGV